MKGKLGAAVAVLRPVLDTYSDSAVGVVGCTSSGIARYSCEYDVLVVGGDKRPPTSIRLGGRFADLAFATEKEVLNPPSPERAMSLASAEPVRDHSMVLSTATAAAAATLSESASKASGTRLASALKTLGRAEVALEKEDPFEADIWLLAGTYEFAYAWLLSNEVLPSPSHLVSQLRSASKESSRSFEGVSIGAGLEAASRAGCGARLEGLAVLHDLLGGGSNAEGGQAKWGGVRTEIMAAKAEELVTRAELAECYSFLGQELVDALMELVRRNAKGSMASLGTGEGRLLGERLVRQLGVVRGGRDVRTGLEILKGQVSKLARKT